MVPKAARRIVATILGCGSSGGVPRVGNQWGDCEPNEPRNRRRRCSLLLTGTTEGHAGKTQVIIDTGCDLREQLLDAEVANLDAVFYTHEHADHTHGIDDLRGFALNARKRIKVYFSARAGARIRNSFSYCFDRSKDSAYPPILEAHEIEAGETVTVDGPGGAITVLAAEQLHGSISTLGFKIRNFFYSCDVSGFPDESHEHLKNLDVWVLDALRPVRHPSHLSLPESLELIARFKPKKAVLTNLHIDMDYARVKATTPDGITPAYDGMRIDVSGGQVLD